MSQSLEQRAADEKKNSYGKRQLTTRSNGTDLEFTIKSTLYWLM